MEESNKEKLPSLIEGFEPLEGLWSQKKSKITFSPNGKSKRRNSIYT
jgi:hypothetical protein